MSLMNIVWKPNTTPMSRITYKAYASMLVLKQTNTPRATLGHIGCSWFCTKQSIGREKNTLDEELRGRQNETVIPEGIVLCNKKPHPRSLANFNQPLGVIASFTRGAELQGWLKKLGTKNERKNIQMTWGWKKIIFMCATLENKTRRTTFSMADIGSSWSKENQLGRADRGQWGCNYLAINQMAQFYHVLTWISLETEDPRHASANQKGGRRKFLIFAWFAWFAWSPVPLPMYAKNKQNGYFTTHRKLRKLCQILVL